MPDFQTLSLSPQQRDQLLALGAQTPFALGDVRRVLGVSMLAAQAFVQTLVDAGDVLQVGTHRAARYLRADAGDENAAPLFIPLLLTALLEGPATPGTLARTLGLDEVRVRATCAVMKARGLLCAAPVGLTVVYSLHARLAARHDPEAARRAPQSTEARFHAQLAALPPEQAARRAAPAPGTSATPLPPALPAPGASPGLRRVVAALDPKIARGLGGLARALGSRAVHPGIRPADRAALHEALALGLASADAGNLNFTRSARGSAWLEGEREEGRRVA